MLEKSFVSINLHILLWFEKLECRCGVVGRFEDDVYFFGEDQDQDFHLVVVTTDQTHDDEASSAFLVEFIRFVALA